MFSIYIHTYICSPYIYIHTHTFIHKTELGFSGGSVVKDLPTKAGDLRAWVQSLGQEDPLE